MTVTVLHNQTIFDLAVQYCGTALAAFDIAKANNLTLTDDLEAGQLLELPAVDYGYSDIVNYFEGKKHQPATAWNSENSTVQPSAEGISYWAIRLDFEVQ